MSSVNVCSCGIASLLVLCGSALLGWMSRAGARGVRPGFHRAGARAGLEAAC